MTPDSRQKLKSLLIDDESYRQFVYSDLTGHLTVGIGRNITTRGISQKEALFMLDEDIFYFSSKLSQLLSFFDNLDDARKIVLINICFNVGVQGLLNFKDMLSYIEKKDYNKASDEILDSKAAHQCPHRYQRLAYIMRTGELP